MLETRNDGRHRIDSIEKLHCRRRRKIYRRSAGIQIVGGWGTIKRSGWRHPGFERRGCGCGECEATGDRQTAITFYKKLIALTAKADAENKEAEEAKAFLASGQKPKVGTVG